MGVAVACDHGRRQGENCAALAWTDARQRPEAVGQEAQIIFDRARLNYLMPIAKEALEAIVKRGNEHLERFEKANKS